MKKINDPVLTEGIIKLYTVDKWSMNKISQLYSISDLTVKRILVENNIEIKKRNLNYTVRENLFEKIQTEEDAYWLGFLYADGNVKKVGNSISLDLAEKDRDMVEKFREYCQLTKELSKHVIKRNDREYVSYNCNFSNEKIKNNLINLGCYPNKSLILECPTEEQVPQHLFHHFVRGYCDGDGFLRWKTDKEERRRDLVILGTEKFLEDMATRMGWNNLCNIKKDGTCQNFRLESYKGDNIYKMMQDMYIDATIYMERKYDNYLRAKKELEDTPM